MSLRVLWNFKKDLFKFAPLTILDSCWKQILYGSFQKSFDISPYYLQHIRNLTMCTLFCSGDDTQLLRWFQWTPCSVWCLAGCLCLGLHWARRIWREIVSFARSCLSSITPCWVRWQRSSCAVDALYCRCRQLLPSCLAKPWTWLPCRLIFVLLLIHQSATGWLSHEVAVVSIVSLNHS